VVARVVVARLVVARVVVEPEVGRRTCLSCSSSPQRQPRRFFALTLFLSASALAQSVPTKFSFTARMVDNGAPVQGTRDFVFRLFPALTSGSEVWTETRNGVSVVDGVVNLELGASTPLTDTVFDGQTLYLEVTASGTVLAPRTPVLSVAYALRATVAGRVGLLTEPDIQKRVTTSCALGSSIRAIASDGTVTCQAAAITVSDGGTVGITGVYGGAGLTGGAATGDVNLAVNFSATGTANTVARSDHNHDRTYLPLGPVLACNSGDKVVSINPTTGNVVCGADTNSTYGAAASGGLAVSGSNQFSLTACLPNQLLVAGAGGTWVCTTQSSGGVASVRSRAAAGRTPPSRSARFLWRWPAPVGRPPWRRGRALAPRPVGRTPTSPRSPGCRLHGRSRRVARGGTTALTARQGIGAAASGANSDITSLSGLGTPLSPAQGGTGLGAPTGGGQFLKSTAGGWSAAPHSS